MTTQPTQAEQMAGNAVRASVFGCQNCKRMQVIFDAARPQLSQKEADAVVREMGWTQRKGAWWCQPCGQKVPQKRERPVATRETHRSDHLVPIK